MEIERLKQLWQQEHTKGTLTQGRGYVLDSPVLKTAQGTQYLRRAGVALIAQTQSHIGEVADFLVGMGFGDETGYSDYLDDNRTVPLTDGVAVAKFAGQLCYLSLGQARTRNVDAAKYIQHVIESGHGSVLEHVNYSLLIYGISRACTHELVRHRHESPSQVSQRYVAGRHLRFVESPESVGNPELHKEFEDWIELSSIQYQRREQIILRHRGIDMKTASTDERKAVRQEARRCLPNEAEAPIVLTGNIRAWRGLIDQRSTPYADVEIARLAWRIFVMLANQEPLFWLDYEEKQRPDGIAYVETKWKKV